MDEHCVLTQLAGVYPDSVESAVSASYSLFIRMATLYEYRHLVYPAHKETFFQAHVHANLLDGILLFDPDFRVIRSECNSTVSSKLKAITGMDDKTKARRWDMIYRHLGTKHHVFICEDKPGSASESDVESDRVKCDEQRISMLRSIVDSLSMEELGAHLEAVTAHTHGLDIVIRGTKKIGEKYVHYTKASTRIPATITSQCAALAEYLMTIISLKRTLMLNFVKLQVASEAVSGYHVMYLSGGEESPDTSPESKDGERADTKQIMDEQFQNHLKTAKETMETVVLGEDVLVAKNREILAMLALKKKLESRHKH
ncbi:hypothetical protein BJV82DRAFT_689784 [Fennellomyces sp. T-0311]|nr:hypothetical protein BJV82DRAFT_689784 [Fennellomyces sp. T-0311]